MKLHILARAAMALGCIGTAPAALALSQAICTCRVSGNMSG